MPDPFVSIIVPTYCRPVPLTACLRSLASLDYPRERYEILVVDDGSGDPPYGALAAVGGEIEVTLLAEEHRGPAAARNAGLAHARGELLAFLDDDCTATPGWLRAFADSFCAVPDRLLGGRTINALPGNLYSSASQLLIDYLYVHHNADPFDARFFASNNLAAPAELLRRSGAFDATFPLSAAEDRELCIRWRRLGHRLTFLPDAEVHHHHDLTFRRFWRQHFTYGRGARRLRALLARQGSDPIPLEPLVFYLRLLRQAHTLRAGASRRLALTGLLALSQLANAVGFAAERSRGEAA